jgi:hypothetical protein
VRHQDALSDAYSCSERTDTGAPDNSIADTAADTCAIVVTSALSAATSE